MKCPQVLNKFTGREETELLIRDMVNAWHIAIAIIEVVREL
jgi:hypothetical protein